MKFIGIIIAVSIAVLSFAGCNKVRPGDTPLTQKAREELNLVLYENSSFHYEMSYPDIFSDKQKQTDGITLSSDESELTVWAKANSDNITLEDSFNNAKAKYSETSNASSYNHTFCFNFKNDISDGYYFGMLYNNIFYEFTMTYPEDKQDDYKSYYQTVQKYFLVGNLENNK